MSQTKHSRQVEGETLLETLTSCKLRPRGIRSPPPTPLTPQHHITHWHPSSNAIVFIHRQPSSPLSFRPPLSPSLTPHFLLSFFLLQMEGEGGGGREGEGRGGEAGVQPRSCHGALILQQLFFSLSLSLVFFSLRMYSVVSFSCCFFFFFFLERNIIAHHFHQPVTSSSFLVCLMQTTLL